MLRIALDVEHAVLGTTVLDVRNRDEESWAGWVPDTLAGFVAAHSGLVGAQPVPEQEDAAPV